MVSTLSVGKGRVKGDEYARCRLDNILFVHRNIVYDIRMMQGVR
jgi:hypothetical protein